MPEPESLNNEDSEETEYSFQEVNPDEIKLGYDNDVQDWLQSNKLIDRSYNFRVYKYVNPNHGERKELVGNWTDCIPTEHEVGQQFGGGRYIAILNITDDTGRRRVTSAKFRIHSSYDITAQQYKANNLFMQPGSYPVMAGNQRGNGSSLNEAMDVLAKMMAIITPAIAMQNNSQNNFPEMMMENYKMINSMMKRSIQDNMQFANDMNRREAGLTETVETDEEASGAINIINQVVPLIEKFMPYITGRNNATTAATITAVKALPQYQQLIKSKSILKSFCEFIDQKHGQEVTDQLLSKFKVKRPRQAAYRSSQQAQRSQSVPGTAAQQ